MSNATLALRVAFVVLLAGCGGGGSGSGGGSPVPPGELPSASPVPTPKGMAAITHVVFIVQENRSFDYMFHDYPGANTVSSGPTHDGGIQQLAETSLAVPWDITHGVHNFLNAYDNGKLDGFDVESLGQPTQPYGYAPASEIAPYLTLASQYVLADNMFASQIDNSFTAHQYLISGQSAGVVDNPTKTPWGCDAPVGTIIPELTQQRQYGPGVFPCFDDKTLGDELDAAKLSWRYYVPTLTQPTGMLWTAYDAIRQIRYGPDWTKNIVSPETTFLTDAQAGNLPAVSWVIPDLLNSDHSGNRSTAGPEWVASLVNAVGTGRDWSSTAIFIVWDDWGGWYDHVPPPQLDIHGLGFRVPMIVVSPYAKRGHISHVQYEFGTLLEFAEARFGLSALSASDSRANPPYDCFDFSQPPRPFQNIQTHRRIIDFVREHPSGRAPDDD